MPRRRHQSEDKVEDAVDEEAADDGGKLRKRGISDRTRDYSEEADCDDEDYGGGRSKGRKRRRMAVSDFFDVEAVVDSADEDEDEVIVDDDFIDPEADIPDVDDGGIHRHPLLQPEDEEEDVEEMEKRIQERYDRIVNVEHDDEEATDDVDQQSLLPSVRDPKLWMVKCVIGREREVAVCLMQKCIDLPELRIKSVVALDNLQNCIYIEADKEAHVKEAIKGMRNIHTSSKIMLVPVKEMTDVLSVKSKAIDVSRDTWARIKIGTYKGDLAKVVDLDNVRQRATVKVIPRIDLQALVYKLGGLAVPKKKLFTPRPRFMNTDEARELLIRVQRIRDTAMGGYFEKIEGMLFKDGFLFKDVSLKSLSTQNVQPTFEELEYFRQSGESVSTLVNRKKGQFMKGDMVIVVKGELRNLKGLVEKVEEDTVIIKPNEKGLPKTLAVRDTELCKCFEPGNHVKVVSGATEGLTGMVVSVEGQMVNFVSDITKGLICAFADNVVESSEVKSESCMMMDNSLTSRFSAQLKTSPCPPLAPIRPRPPRGGGYSGGHSNFGGRGGGRGQDPFIGVTVKIGLGNYKGCKGRVRDVKGSTVRIELESQMKTIAVDRSHISVSDNVNVPRPETETPMHPCTTPFRDSCVTPYHDGMRTPMRVRAWNPYTPTSTPPRMARVG